MNRGEVLGLHRAHKATHAQSFGVIEPALFGSFARDQATRDSDVNILLQFSGPGASKGYFGIQFNLEDLLGRPVDLVTDKAQRAEFRPYLKREAVNV